DFHELSTGSKQQNRPELRVHTAAYDQLVPIELYHALYRHALKVPDAGFLAYCCFNGTIRTPNGIRIANIQVNPTYIGLVGDGFREQLDDYGIAHFRSFGHSLVFGKCNLGPYGGKAVGRE